MAVSPARSWTIPLGCLLILMHEAHCFILPNATHLESLLSRYRDEKPHSRAKRSIPWSDREEILMLHNKLRGQVYPSASNMEYMTWDDELERSAEAWAHECIWDHGPANLLPSIGQNLAVHWGRYRTPAFHVQSWYDEVKDYTYPYPHECNPWCPERCSGAMCTHYTQIVWATTTKMGCAVNICKKMNVWGDIWENAVYLVCNYSPKGNWIGEAPYKNGRPCSECPPSYGGSCKDNLCYKDNHYAQKPETDETNEVETPPNAEEKYVWAHEPVNKPRATKPKKTTPADHYMTQVIKCDTKMRDSCKGSTCNRYLCPAGCMNSKAKVFGTFQYESSSSICRAALHFGVIDNRGGLVDITRKGRTLSFVKSTRHGVETLSKNKPSNAFMVSQVTVQTLDCYTTVAELCQFKKPAAHCPRVYCPAYCKDEPSYWAPVYGTNIYADNSSICKTAVHAGIIANGEGGYVDVMPVDKKKYYNGSLKNGIKSESLKSPREGKAFRIFAVKQ
ncbi:cysteine-rich secretory protein LCCL domain-containing 2 [Alligator mississippiensis]|uniref:Cysteine-rich secretory protein LCCL domain-containing 1 n=1 Tax=Alligator mississippiensis TaxID=8496 RepID=A0A151NMA0_ALLMI|nr:cysteine-rich secretory protein LCCL domain-containing 2 [Alligator mississippiensis]KYO37904.1 cysteine-rich secretory protein LCCL domain-containing 1 [Alligator mississippiensis]